MNMRYQNHKVSHKTVLTKVTAGPILLYKSYLCFLLTFVFYVGFGRVAVSSILEVVCELPPSH